MNDIMTTGYNQLMASATSPTLWFFERLPVITGDSGCLDRLNWGIFLCRELFHFFSVLYLILLLVTCPILLGMARLEKPELVKPVFKNLAWIIASISVILLCNLLFKELFLEVDKFFTSLIDNGWGDVGVLLKILLLMNNILLLGLQLAVFVKMPYILKSFFKVED